LIGPFRERLTTALEAAPLRDYTVRMQSEYFDVVIVGAGLSGVGTAEGMKEWIKPIIDESPLDVATRDGGGGGSDHMSFARHKIPVVFSITGLHPDYHTPRDTSDKINRVGAVMVIDLYDKILQKASTIPDRFVYKSTRRVRR